MYAWVIGLLVSEALNVKSMYLGKLIVSVSEVTVIGSLAAKACLVEKAIGNSTMLYKQINKRRNKHRERLDIPATPLNLTRKLNRNMRGASHVYWNRLYIVPIVPDFM